METFNDRWDLSYLYPDFDDEQFKSDLASLKDEAQKGIAILQDSSLTRLARLEQIKLQFLFLMKILLIQMILLILL